jgi:membrane protease YdiL (CAAX protease family)
MTPPPSSPATVWRTAAGTLRGGWKALGCGGLIVVAATLVSALLELVPALQPAGPWLDLGGVLLASWICLRLEGRPLASIGLAVRGRWAAQFGLGVGAGAALLLATALFVWLLGGFHLERAGTASAGAIANAGALMLGAAMSEELAFRGYPFQRAAQAMGARAALPVLALLFMLAHRMEPGMAPGLRAVASGNIFLAGILLGLCYLRTGSLALPVGLHLGWNWTMELLGFSISGTPAADSLWVPVFDSHAGWLTGGPYGLEASAVSVPVLALAVLWLARRGRAGLQSAP